MDTAADGIGPFEQIIGHAAAVDLHTVSRYPGLAGTDGLFGLVVIVEKLGAQREFVFFPHYQNIIGQGQFPGGGVIQTIPGGDMGLLSIFAKDIGIDSFQNEIVGQFSGQGLSRSDLRGLFSHLELDDIGVLDHKMMLIGLTVGEFRVISASWGEKGGHGYPPEGEGQDKKQRDQPDEVSSIDHRLM